MVIDHICTNIDGPNCWAKYGWPSQFERAGLCKNTKPFFGMEPKDFTSLKSDFFNTLTLLISKDLCGGTALGKQMRKSCPDNDDDDYDDGDDDDDDDLESEWGTVCGQKCGGFSPATSNLQCEKSVFQSRVSLECLVSSAPCCSQSECGHFRVSSCRHSLV